MQIVTRARTFTTGAELSARWGGVQRRCGTTAMAATLGVSARDATSRCRQHTMVRPRFVLGKPAQAPTQEALT
jgi:hypothetical protein